MKYVTVPQSKSLAHRAIICSTLAGKPNVSRRFYKCFSDDTLYTEVLAKMFFEAMEDKEKYKSMNLHCGDSGSTLRFFIPLACLLDIPVTFVGGESLSARPLGPYLDLFEAHGIAYSLTDGTLPLTVKGQLCPGTFRLPGNVSSQFISGLLLVLPLLEGDSTIELTTPLESADYVTLTIDALKKHKICVLQKDEYTYTIAGNQKYVPADWNSLVEGDYSQAAFFIVAGLLHPPQPDGSPHEIRIKGLPKSTIQADRVILDIVKDMGGEFYFDGEDLIVKSSKTHGTTIDVSGCPDLVPILAVLGAFSEGETNIINGARLRLKESDRLLSISTELARLGADITQMTDGLVIRGKESLNAFAVDSWNDHRIAMSLAVASIRCNGCVHLSGHEAVSKSYGSFFKDFVDVIGYDLVKEKLKIGDTLL